MVTTDWFSGAMDNTVYTQDGSCSLGFWQKKKKRMTFIPINKKYFKSQLIFNAVWQRTYSGKKTMFKFYSHGSHDKGMIRSRTHPTWDLLSIWVDPEYKFLNKQFHTYIITHGGRVGHGHMSHPWGHSDWWLWYGCYKDMVTHDHQWECGKAQGQFPLVLAACLRLWGITHRTFTEWPILWRQNQCGLCDNVTSHAGDNNDSRTSCLGTLFH